MFRELFDRRSYENDWVGGFPLSESDLKPVRGVLVDFLSKDAKVSSGGFTYKSIPVDLENEGRFDLYVFAVNYDPDLSLIGLSIQKKEGFCVDNLRRGALYIPSLKYFNERFYDKNFQFELRDKIKLINEDVIKLLESNK